MVIVRSGGWLGGMIIVQGRPKTEVAEGKFYHKDTEDTEAEDLNILALSLRDLCVSVVKIRFLCDLSSGIKFWGAGSTFV